MVSGRFGNLPHGRQQKLLNPMNYRGQRVTVMGLGHFGGGMAAARWLAAQGAIVTATDLAAADSFGPALATLGDVPLAQLHLGGHMADDFRTADLVVVNPAVRPGNEFLQIARQSGARLATEIELLLEACPACTVGVTGSNGKSTTAAMIAAILQAQGLRTWLGGNIGGSLLPALHEMRPDDWAVLELSSFQLWHSGPDTRMPHVAVVTNCTPNHLDWHATMADYVAAKQRLFTGQRADDVAVLNTADAEVSTWRPLVRGALAPAALPDALPPLLVPGAHNRTNAACAAAAATAAGCSAVAVRRGLATFGGLPQRLEWFAMVDGRRFYNDSTSTTPQSTVAALQSLPPPVWLLVGGHDKGFDFQEMLAAIARHAAGTAFYGEVGGALLGRLTAQFPGAVATSVATMDAALRWCWQRSQPGDAIVLSPACSSHDQFRNFRQRGEAFVDAVGSLTQRHVGQAFQPDSPYWSRSA
jgi:UDP-N-acetylmuramoylalanine--D-glutamate ligase